MKLILNIGLFYFGWFAAVVGAANHNGWQGPLVVSLCSLIHLMIQRRSWGRELIAMFFIALVGSSIDSIAPTFGVITFSATSPSVFPNYPLWLSMLWFGFASTFPISLAWMAGRYKTAAIVGFVGGPLSYLSAEAMGAVQISSDNTFAIIVIALLWSIAVPSTLWTYRAIGVARMPSLSSMT